MILAKRTFTVGDKRTALYCEAVAEIEHLKGNNEPYFSITVKDYESGIFGCIHEIIADKFPKLAPYIKWHLCGPSGPIYYFENGLYHLKQGHIDHFKSTVVWGVVETDEKWEQDLKWIELEIGHASLVETEKLQKRIREEAIHDEFKAYLRERLPAVCQKFKEDMIFLFGDQIKFS